jgi:hypothetical protein
MPIFRVADGFSEKWKRTLINQDLPDLPDVVIIESDSSHGTMVIQGGIAR